MSGTLVRDLSGRPVFTLTDKGEIRDAHGKSAGKRVGPDDHAVRLAAQAASWMDGKSVQMDLGPSDVSTPATQAELGVGDDDNDYVADTVSRVVLSKQTSGVWYTQNPTDIIKLPLPSIGGHGTPPEVNPTYASTTFKTAGYALAARLPRMLVDNADFDIKKRTLRFLVESLRLAREYRVAALLTLSTSYAASNRIAATTKWNGTTNADPLNDLFKALKASLLPANVLVLPESAAQYFFSENETNTTSVRDYVQAGGQLPRIMFARSKFGATPTYVWAPATTVNVALIRDVPAGDRVPTSLTFRWLGDGTGDGERVGGFFVREFWDSQTDAHWIVCAHDDAEVIVHNKVGSVITGALA